jgi:hypothetical protein
MNKQIRDPNPEIRSEFEYQNPRAEFTASNRDSKRHDLEDRTFEFAKASRAFVKRLRRTIANIEDAKQFIRASGSIGANYIEANESIGKKRLSHESEDLPSRSQRKRLLASIARL